MPSRAGTVMHDQLSDDQSDEVKRHIESSIRYLTESRNIANLLALTVNVAPPGIQSLEIIFPLINPGYRVRWGLFAKYVADWRLIHAALCETGRYMSTESHHAGKFDDFCKTASNDMNISERAFRAIIMIAISGSDVMLEIRDIIDTLGIGFVAGRIELVRDQIKFSNLIG